MQDFIERLLKAKGAERKALAIEMGKHGREAVSAVDRLLTSRNRDLRLAAAMVLSYAGHHDAVSGLALALKDPDPLVRLQAASGLGAFRRPAARQALWLSFPDKNRAVSLAILRSLEKLMTDEMAAALRVMDTSRLSPPVAAEIQAILNRYRPATKTLPTVASPLSTSPWLSMLPGEYCAGMVVPGMEDIAVRLLSWQVPQAEIESVSEGEVRFRLAAKSMPALIRSRIFLSIWVLFPRDGAQDPAENEAVVNAVYAYAHAKGLRSLLIWGQANPVLQRRLEKKLELYKAKPPGNPRTLRLRMAKDWIWVEHIAESDFPTLRHIPALTRALGAGLAAVATRGNEDVFLNPFCGDGSLIVERGLLGPAGRLIGLDREEEKLAQAGRHWHIISPITSCLHEAASFSPWQGTEIPLPAAAADAIAFFAGSRELAALNLNIYKEFIRVLKPGGIIAVLTPDPEKIRELTAAAGLKLYQEKEIGKNNLSTLMVAST
ncbi:MAG TPA: hypothetical protein GXX29_08020 [Firmicutes bacterium]|nr:hypothetical protein [Bacillota bacterium]